MNKIGLIAGYGKLPFLWAKQAKNNNTNVFAFLISEEYSKNLDNEVYSTDYLSFTQFDKLINKLKSYNIKKVIMLGKVNKKHLYEKNDFDKRFMKLLEQSNNLDDHSILNMIVNEFENEGIEVLKQTTFFDHLLTEDGLINNIKPKQELLDEMKYAFSKAKGIADLDIGQTVLTKDKAVVAVEAIEGTDLTIKRAGNIINKGSVMAKVSKNSQDLRFDLPTIGLNTVKNLISINASALVLESKRILMLEKDEIIELADKHDLSIYSISGKEV
ncbi:MAG: UDP-2,3-diacylglucosamine diphosphatase LpxI [Halanaerobiales bacterium]|nr:UDP-2,3-diacylglucosamine diphosphatase LpxI [Halanaerobiales bacterium]